MVKEIAETRPLSKEEEIEVIKKLQDPNSSDQEKKDCFETLMLSNKGLISSEINKCIAKYRLQKSCFDDLMQDFFLVAFNAALNFDVSKNVRFMSYAQHFIRRVVVEYNENFSRPHSLPTNFFSEVSSLFKNNGASSKITKNRAQDMLRSYNANYISINMPIGEDSQSEFGDFIPEQPKYKIDKKLIETVLSPLSNREKQIVMNFYGINDQKNFAETARELNMSRERIRQLHNQALNKIKNILSQKNIFSVQDCIECA